MHFSLPYSNRNVPHIIHLAINSWVNQDSLEYKSLRMKLSTFNNHAVDGRIDFVQMLMKNNLPLTMDAADNNFQKYMVGKLLLLYYVEFESLEMGQTT